MIRIKKEEEEEKREKEKERVNKVVSACYRRSLAFKWMASPAKVLLSC
jgi:hypothetical protein